MTEGNEAVGSEVWIINHYAITPDLPGGTRHYDFGYELVKRGYRVCIFASDVNLALRRHTRLKPGELYREEDVNGVRFVWVGAAEYQTNDWRRAWNIVTFTFNVIKVCVGRRSRPQAVIGSSPHLLAPLAAWLVSKLKKCRFILELRDLWPQALIDMGELGERSATARCFRLLERFLCRAADSIIVLASGSRDYLLSRGVDARKIAYIPNGVHLANFGAVARKNLLDTITESSDNKDDGSAIARLRSKFGFDRFTIVYTGAHGVANSLGTILEAASLMRHRDDIQFVLVGDGPTKNELMNRSRQMNLGNVRFMDPVPKEQIPELLAAADAAVITLQAAKAFSYAISPNKLFDYMAAGKPVLCAVPGEMARLVRENGAGIAVEPESPRDLADAAVRLKEMPAEERHRMSYRGRAVVEENFSRERLAEDLIRVLFKSETTLP